MTNRFTIADLHLGHKGMIQFVRADGTPLRPEWGRADPERLMGDEEAAERVEAMNEALIDRWNAVVGPKDIVEVLGDVVINRRALPLLGRLQGRKRLRMGNHDIFVKKHSVDYHPYFEEITAYKVMPKDGIIMCHVPVHPPVGGTLQDERPRPHAREAGYDPEGAPRKEAQHDPEEQSPALI